MKAEELGCAMNHFSDALLKEAEVSQRKKTPRRGWLRWTAVAACAGILVGLGAQLFRGNQNAAPQGMPGKEHTGYLSYAGPILPLCIPESMESITARRELTLDFSHGQKNQCQVTDVYTISNKGTAEAHITLEYPYADNLRNTDRPTVFVNGEETDFETAVGESLGLSDSVNRWEQYQTALADGAYLQRALEPVSLSEEMAVVYFVTEPTQVRLDEPGAPTVNLQFRQDEETTVLSYGFNGGVYGDADSWQGRSFFLPRQESGNAEQLRCLIVLGGDIQQLTVQGYTDGGLTGSRDDLTAAVTRQELPLAQVLSLALEDLYRQWETNEGESWPPEGISGEACMAQVQRALPEFLEKTREGSDTGELEMLFSHVSVGRRVLYCGLTLDIPAGETVELTVCYPKKGSFDYPGMGGDREGVCGFDMVTGNTLLQLTEQRVQVLPGEGLEITEQSFGLDPENGQYQATLDPRQQHFMLEIRKVS